MGVRVMALQEQAEEFGYSTIQEALDAGYEVSYRVSGNHKLYKPDEQDKAHEAWLKEKHEVLHLLESVKEDIVELNGGDNNHAAIDELDYVIDFIEKGEE